MMSAKESQACRMPSHQAEPSSVHSSAPGGTLSEFQHAGFSLTEVTIGLLLAIVVAGFALINISGILPGMRANEASSQTLAQLRRGRELAIAQRRNVEVRGSWETTRSSSYEMTCRPETRF